MENMIQCIESKTLLNRTAIIRYALAELYKAEKMKEENVNGDIYGITETELITIFFLLINPNGIYSYFLMNTMELIIHY